MAKKIKTIFQNIDKAFNDGWIKDTLQIKDSLNADPDKVIYTADNEADYEKKKLELQQNSYLKERWVRANADLSVKAFNGLNNIKLMYRDVELMDSFPEIGAALDLVAEEACTISQEGGHVINVYSKSDRIKNILEDLFVNRLNLNVTAVSLIRGMCKYGNQYMLLNLDNNLGVCGWRELPPFGVERLENGITNPYGGYTVTNQITKNMDLSTRFTWSDENSGSLEAFRNWQIAHFRLLTDTLYFPYGCSYLNKARRHFRMLSLMEDMMLIYRLDRSVERRVFKIFVGAIDDADVEAYMENIVNQFKRKQIIDPITGQIDLRKNLLNSMDDIFIPVRDSNSQSTIETLPAAQNLTAIDDIKYMQNKVLSALRIPKSFLNFEEAQGDGKNLALMDIRFTRVINRIQQAFLLELTKVATIHLYLLGFEDELTNFTLSMNNPSTQSEQLDTENMQKKILAVRDAVSDPGNGIPIMSLTRALRSIMKWSDKEIQDNFEELRLEKGLSAELEKTSQIIKKTGIFDTVDRIYGEPGAEYQDDNAQQGNDDSGLGSPSGGGGGIGGDLGDIGNSGLEDVSDDNSDVINGNPEETPLGDENQPIENNNKNESTNKNSKLILESNQYNQKENLSDEYHKILNKLIQNKPKGNIFERCELFDKNFLINEEMNEVANNLEKYTK